MSFCLLLAVRQEYGRQCEWGNKTGNEPTLNVVRIPPQHIKELVDRCPFPLKGSKTEYGSALESNPSGRRTIIRNDITTSSNAHAGIAVTQTHTPVQTRRAKKGRIKSSTIAVYASIFVLLVVFIAIGYRAPQQTSGVANAASLSGSQASEEKTAVNEVVATTIAATVANTTELSVAPSVTSLAISTQIESELPETDDSTISKPSIVQLSAASRNIQTYTVQAGDTVDTLSARFGISKDTIKWANDMVSDILTVGDSIKLLPRNGIIYTVKSGDTIESIADKYKAQASVIRTYNDLEISGISQGLQIIIPDGVLPTNERPGYVAPVSRGGYYAGYRAGSVGNRYAFGNCTWYVYERRASMGRPVGSFWGNGGSWAYSAAASGYTVNRSPAAGAVLVEAAGRIATGHVALVETVNGDGSIVISEMNNGAYGGFNIVNNRTISAGEVGLYQYIH